MHVSTIRDWKADLLQKMPKLEDNAHSFYASLAHPYSSKMIRESVGDGLDEEGDDHKPSYGDMLQVFARTPVSSRRTTRSSSATISNSSSSCKLNLQGIHHESDFKSPSSTLTTSTSFDEPDQGIKISSEGTSSTGRKRSSPSKTRQKRKKIDAGQFEGMKEIPDRLAENLDSKSSK